MQLTVYDTTLRDGCQDPRLSMSNETKLEAVVLLDRFGVDYIELAWPVSENDIEFFKQAQGLVKNSKIVVFSSTRKIKNTAEEDHLLNLALRTEADYVTLFGKTWKQHVEKQLKATPEQNLEAIADSVRYLKEKGKTVFYDAEHFFDGYKDDKDYALKCLDASIDAGASVVVLCDTNGGCLFDEITEITREVKQHLDEKYQGKVELGVHCHNDTGCATANTIAAVQQGAGHIQGTVNGIGERAGNADLCTVLPNLVFKKGHSLNNRINLSGLKELSKDMYETVGLDSVSNQPYVGEGAFAHNGGIHVDAVIKGATYDHFDPSLAGNTSKFALSRNSGRATVVEIAKGFGYKTDKDDPKVKEMLAEVKEMNKQGYNFSILEAEHYLLTEKHFGNYEDIFVVDDWHITSMRNKDSICKIWGKAHGQDAEALEDIKGGPVDAAYKAIKQMVGDPRLDNVHLVHYGVEIPKSGSRGEASTVNVYITFKNKDKEWTTVGNDPNIIEASIEAISKGFRYYLLKNRENKAA